MTPFRLVHHPDAVAEADAAVQLNNCGALGRPRITVRNADGHCLLERADVLQGRVTAEGIEEPLLDSPRIAEHVVDIVRKQLLAEGVAAGAPARGRTRRSLSEVDSHSGAHGRMGGSASEPPAWSGPRQP